MLFAPTQRKPSFYAAHKLIYGPPKIGKTTLAASLVENDRPPLFIMTEKGDTGLSVHAIHVTCWASFLAAKKRITDNIDQVRREYSCIVVDLVSELDEFCSQAICDREGVTYIGDIPHGKGWTLQKNAFRTAMKELMDAMPVTCLAHSKDREVPHGDDKDQKQTAPLMANGAFEYINGKVDLIAFLKPIKNGSGKVQLTMRPTDKLLAGSRFPAIAKDYLLDLSAIYQALSRIQEDLNRVIS